VISLVVASRQAGGDWPTQIPDIRVWRGPRAPAAAPPHELRGSVSTHALPSAALRCERELTVYQPPGAGRPVPGCLLADGEAVQGFAPALDSAIEAGAVPPVLLVGLHNAPGALTARSDLRAQEYLPGHNRRRFDAHLRFVTDEVIPWAGERFGPVAGPWVAAGFSNGASWAITAAQRRPDLIGAVAAFSAGMVPRRISGAARSARIPHYLAAGTLEPGFRRSTRQWAERLVKAGFPCRHEEWIGGHDQKWWEQQLPVALGWLLPAPGLAAPGLAAPGSGRDDHGPDGQDRRDDDEHDDRDHGHRAPDEQSGPHAHVGRHDHARAAGDGGVHRDPAPRPDGWPTGQGSDQLSGDVGGDRGQLPVGAGRERLAAPRVEFVPDQPALHERGLEQVDHPLAVGVRGPQACRGSRFWSHRRLPTVFTA